MPPIKPSKPKPSDVIVPPVAAVVTPEAEVPAAVEPPKPSKHILAVDKAIADISANICDAMFVDTIEEARKLMAAMPNEHHVMQLRDERGELEFLLRRRASLLAGVTL